MLTSPLILNGLRNKARQICAADPGLVQFATKIVSFENRKDKGKYAAAIGVAPLCRSFCGRETSRREFLAPSHALPPQENVVLDRYAETVRQQTGFSCDCTKMQDLVRGSPRPRTNWITLASTTTTAASHRTLGPDDARIIVPMACACSPSKEACHGAKQGRSITLSVVRGVLETTQREMTMALEQTARSSVFNLAHDYSTALFNHTPEMILQGQDIPIPLGVLI